MTRYLVVADIGCNHLGSMSLAKEMIEAAYDAGVSIVKFQYYRTEDIESYEKDRPDSLYTREIFEAIRETEFSIDQMKELKAHADKVGIEFLCTPFLNVDRLNELERVVNPKRWKIRQRDSENEALLKAAIATGKEIFLSVSKKPDDPFILYHPNIKILLCIAKYPFNMTDLDLSQFEFFDGFSCHLPNTTASLAAATVALKAGKELFIIEKHLKMPGTTPIDDKVSITPDEFARLVKHLRRLEKCGTGPTSVFW